MISAERLALLAFRWQVWIPVAVFVALAIGEALWPERRRVSGRLARWTTNLGLELLGRWLALAVGPYGLAVMIQAALGSPPFNLFAVIRGWGGAWAVLAAGCILLDLGGYLIHRLEHAVFPLWRLHSVHHADTDVDASTAVRHHPFDNLFSGTLIVIVVVLMRMPVWVLPVYIALAAAVQFFQHANIRLPEWLEGALGLVLVTPGLHRAHHAVDPAHYNSNFGTVLSVWDRIFATTGPRLPAGDTAPAFGVEQFRDARYAWPWWALLLPFMMRRPRG